MTVRSLSSPSPSPSPSLTTRVSMETASMPTGPEIDDAATLAEILGFTSRKGASRNAEPSDCDLPEGEEESNSTTSSHLSGSPLGPSRHPKNHKNPDSRAEHSKVYFEEGDLVWAKAFPYTWWPGRIDKTKGSTAFVAFFGCDRTRWYGASEIRGFEENYARMSKLVGVKLADAIDVALGELGWRAASKLICPCQGSDVEAKKGFEPSEMLGFVIGVAISAWFADEETPSVVMASAQVYAFRRFAWMCCDTEASRGCHPDSVGVSLPVDDEESVGFAETIVQSNARGQTMESRDDKINDESEGDDQEVSDSSLESQVVHAIIREPHDDFSVDIQEENDEAFQEQVQEGSNICVINTVDFSFLDLDEEYESLRDNQSYDVIDWSQSTEGICRNERLEEQKLHTGSSSREPDVETGLGKHISQAEDGNENEGSMDSLPHYDANLMLENIENHCKSGIVVRPAEGIGRNECLEKQNLCTGISLQEPDVEKALGKCFSHAEDGNGIAGNGTEFHVNEGSMDSLAHYDANHMLENIENHCESANVVWSAEGIGRNECLEKNNLRTGTSLQESDVETALGKCFSHVEAGNGIVGNGTEFHVNEGSMDSLPHYDANHMLKNIEYHCKSGNVVQSGEDIAFGNISVTTSETKSVNQKQEITTTSTTTTTTTTTTTEYESLLDNQTHVVIDWNWSAEGIGRNECLKKQDLLTGSSSQELDVETALGKCFSHAEDGNGTRGNGTEFHVNEGSVDSLTHYDGNHMLENIENHCESGNVNQSGENIAFGNISVTTSETRSANQKQETTTSIEHEISDSAAVLPLPSYSLLKAIPCKEGLLYSDHASKCDADSINEKLKLSVRCQSSPITGLANNQNVDGKCTANSIPGRSSPTETVSESVIRKRRHDQTVPCNNSLKPCKSLKNSCNKSHTNHEVIVARAVTKRTLLLMNADNNVKKPRSGDNYSIVSGRNNAKNDHAKSGCNLTLPMHVSKSNILRKKGVNQSVPSSLSKWHRLYASPLIRDCSNSTSNVQKSGGTHRSSSLPKSLHMKFPKDFNLPSKEELEKKFAVFGPLDCSRTKVVFYTGSGRVVFLNQADANAAYKYAKRKNVFGEANVRFWLDEYENYRKERAKQDLSVPLLEHSSLNIESCTKELSTPIVGQTPLNLASGTQDLSVLTPMGGQTPLNMASCTQDLSAPIVGHSPSNLKSCLKRPNTLLASDAKKICKVRFLMET